MYDLDAPSWYWYKEEWNRFRVELAIAGDKVKTLEKKLLTENYPSCNIENWWV